MRTLQVAAIRSDISGVKVERCERCEDASTEKVDAIILIFQGQGFIFSQTRSDGPPGSLDSQNSRKCFGKNKMLGCRAIGIVVGGQKNTQLEHGKC